MKLFKKFINKFNPGSKIHDYNFYYEGKIIEPKTYERPIEDNQYFGKKESFIITVEKNIKIIKCPKCIYNDCVISISNFKTIFYNCQFKHLESSSYSNYISDQKYYPEKIRCSGNDCCKTAKVDPNFFLCLTCSKLIMRSVYFCNECIEKHNHDLKDKNKHFIINYEDKIYFCKNHSKKYENYCFQCKKNLCNDCTEEHLKNQEKHKGHQIKNLNLLVPEDKELEGLKGSLKEIKKNIESLQIIINDLYHVLNEVIKEYHNYYLIANHIIEKYELFNNEEKAYKSFAIFKSLHNLKFSNFKLLEDLKSIINEENLLERTKKLIEHYNNIRNNYQINDLNKEDDDDEWFKEVCGREKERKLKETNMPANTSNNINNINGMKIENKNKNEK